MLSSTSEVSSRFMPRADAEVWARVKHGATEHAIDLRRPVGIAELRNYFFEGL